MDHIDVRRVHDGKSYLAFRSEWRIVYRHLTAMIRDAKTARRWSADDQGTAASKVATVLKRRPNTDERRKRMERFVANEGKAHRLWRDRNAVCLSLKGEARDMMAALEEVKKNRPPRKEK